MHIKRTGNLENEIAGAIQSSSPQLKDVVYMITF